jgi:hypothetical protein
MKRTLISAGLGCAVVAAAFMADRSDPKRLFDKNNLVAWCIVPFDAKKRGPEERAKMLADLGIRKLAYDWRDKDIPTFDQELDALNRHKIKLHAFWLTSGPKPGKEKNVSAVLDFLKRRKAKTELWYMFIPPKDFNSLSQDAKVAMTSEAVRFLASEAASFGGSVGLYNHGGWFGEPANQIAIVKKLGMKNIGLVYNFHHGKAHAERFAEIFPAMMPYLMAVNVNGMRKDGPQILPVGKGDLERDMLRVVIESGYRGPIGILGHREDEDAEVALRQNLEGLEILKKSLAGAKVSRL